MEKIRIEYRRVDEITPYKNNPRKNDKAVDAVAESIRQFGFRNPIVLDKNDEIVCGHTRLKAAIKLGLVEVPCIRADDLTEAQIKAYRLADNKTAERASWDDDLLATELSAIDLDMSVFGFDLVSKDDVHEDDFDEKPPETPITMPGDIWQLGRHRLLCGDSTDPDNLKRLMDGAFVDMLLTDPPYNVDYTGKTKDALKIKNDVMADDKFRTFLRTAFFCADSVMKPGAVFYIWHADSEGYNFRGACHDINWSVRQCLIWKKNSMVLGRQDYQWAHEPCIYGWKEGASHLWASNRKQTTVLEFDRPTRSKEHPTMKPVLLFDYLIRNNTKAMDLVLDPFLGSGTTTIACEQNGRTCYGMELDPKYCDVIVNRAIRQFGSDEGVFLIRDGERIPHAVLAEAS